MKKYVKKPVVIHAEQWLGLTEQYDRFVKEGVIFDVKYEDGSCLISTLEGDMKCNLNDYIIKGIKGEYYPCKPDIFEASYFEHNDSDYVK